MVQSLGDSFGWPFRDPAWVGKLLIMGLIFLIPIVGWINLLGWTLDCVSRLRAGSRELPPAGFQYLGRGFQLGVVLLVYGIAAAIIPLALVAGALAATAAFGSPDTSPGGGLAALLLTIGYLLAIAASLAIYAIYPIILIETERGGIGGGLNFGNVLARFRGDSSSSLLAGLVTLAGLSIGGLGAFLCLIGIVLTAAYGYAVVAGAAAWLAWRQEGGPGLAPPPSYPPPYPPPPAAG